MFFSPLAAIQFSAILGDLLHKQDLYVKFGDFSIETTCHFANYQQACYLHQRVSGLVPPGHHSVHSLGTYFEHYYYSNISFRIDYLSFVTPSCSPCQISTYLGISLN